jgi:molybdopterin converting factor small subunit
VNVYVNDEDVRFTGGLETALSDGDQVVVLPAVAGGALDGRARR